MHAIEWIVILASIGNLDKAVSHFRTGLEEATCLKDDLMSPAFSAIPGDYRPLYVSVPLCKKQCSAIHMGLSGMQTGKLCLCAFHEEELVDNNNVDKCPENCGNKSCGGIDGFTSVYFSDTKLQDSPIRLQLTKHATSQVKIAAQENFESFPFNFGDGSPIVTVHAPFSAIYRVPGIYEVTAFGNGDDITTATFSVHDIESKLESVECPTVAEPGIEAACRITMTGSSPQLTISHKESTTKYMLPGSSWITYGIPVPRSHMREISNLFKAQVLLVHWPVRETVKIMHVEYFAVSKGSIILKMYKMCDEDYSCSNGQKIGELIVEEKESYVLKGGNVDNVSVSEEISKELLAQPGYLFGFECVDGCVGHRLSSKEEGDLVGGKPFPGEHYFHVVTTIPTSVQFLYTCSDPSTEEAIKISSGHTIEIRVISCEIPIDDISLKGNSVAVVGENVTYSVFMKKGLPITIRQDWGDGHVAHTHYQGTITKLDSARISHAYQEPGNYTLIVSASNRHHDVWTPNATLNISVSPQSPCELAPKKITFQDNQVHDCKNYSGVAHFQGGNIKTGFLISNRNEERKIAVRSLRDQEVSFRGRHCYHPQATILNHSLDFLQAPGYLTSEQIRLQTKVLIDCSYIIHARKYWNISRVDQMSGKAIEVIAIDKWCESWNRSELIISPGFLHPGTYSVQYTITMNDSELHSNMLKGTDSTYIRIKLSPLEPYMFNGIASRLRVGVNQSILFEPGLWSVDPGDSKGNQFTLTWFCQPVIDTQTSNASGCFGKGPGQLAYYSKVLNLSARCFTDPIGRRFEVIAVVAKGSRRATARIELEIISSSTLSVLIECISSCINIEGNIIVNPNSGLRLRGRCIPACSTDTEYVWTVFNSSCVLSQYAKNNQSGSEVAIPKEITQSSKEFSVTFMVRSRESEASATLDVRVNQTPRGGKCLVNATSGVTLIDTLLITCESWDDPDGISEYSCHLLDAKGRKHHILAISCMPVDVMLPVGLNQLYCDIIDKLGGYTRVPVANITMDIPSLEEYQDFSSSGKLKKFAALGDVQQLMTYFQAQSSVWLASKAYQLNISQIGHDIEFMTELLSLEANAATLAQINVVSSSLSAALSYVFVGDDGPLVIGLKARAYATNAIKMLSDHVKHIPITDPREMVYLIEHVAEAALALMVSSAAILHKKNCSYIPFRDLETVNELDYDTNIEGKLEFKMPVGLNKQQCENILNTLSYKASKETPQILESHKLLYQSAIDKMVRDELLTMTSEHGVHVLLAKVHQMNLENHMLELGNGNVSFPSGICVGNEGDVCTENLAISAVNWPVVTHNHGPTTKLLSHDGNVMDITLLSEELEDQTVSNLKTPIVLNISRKGLDRMSEPVFVNTSLKLEGLRVPIIYHAFNVTREDSSITIEYFLSDDVSHNFVLLMDHERMPTLDSFQWIIPLASIHSDGKACYNIFFNNDMVGKRTGRFFAGIAEFVSGFNYSTSDTKIKLDHTHLRRQFSTDYFIRIFTSGCYYYDDNTNSWSSSGMKVMRSSYLTTTCETNHLTSFASGFFVEPNTVDFNYVFAHASFTDNLTIYVCIIITLALYILMLIWARKQDKKDAKKLVCQLLPDNNPKDTYLYEMLVCTGNASDAATSSKISFILSGELDETEVRTFGKPSSNLFRKGGADQFILSVPRPLGSLNYLHIWHDNSGKGCHGSWFLNLVVVKDLQTGETFEFIADSWFAVEKGDGAISRVLPVASIELKDDFAYLFHSNSQKNLRDGHLWFSVFLRPPKSRFTRVQRVSTCVSLMYLSMLTNAMWYDRTKSDPKASVTSFGPFSLSLEQVGVGLLSSIIMFLPSLAIVTLFRKSRPYRLRPNRIAKAVHESEWQFQGTDTQHGTKIIGQTDSKRNRKPRCSLPWPFQYVAWLLVLLCICVSIFFLWSYGIQFGNEKIRKWLTSFLVSLMSSVFLTEPIKVILAAVIFSLTCKSNGNRVGDDDADCDEENFTLVKNNRQKPPGFLNVRHAHKPTQSQNASINRDARSARLKEIKMWEFGNEIAAYSVFLLVIVILSYGNRDPNGYYLQKCLRESFVDRHRFAKVNNTNDLWHWIHKAVISELHTQAWYNAEQPYGLGGFLNDKVNRLLGYGVIRQVRVKASTCKAPSSMTHFGTKCAAYSRIVNEDTLDYCVRWQFPNKTRQYNSECYWESFRYKTAEELEGYPLVGHIDAYSGGGYVVPLRGRQEELKMQLKNLQAYGWIDSRTRAIILEFSTYNSQVNLFGIATMMAEFLPGGGVHPFWRFDAVHLFHYNEGFGLVLLICEFAFVLFIFYYTYREVSNIRKLRKQYFFDYWNFAELFFLAISYVTFVVYIWRYFATRAVTETFSRTHGNGYIKLQFTGLLDDIFGYLIAFIMFISLLKFNKLFRFNKRMGILGHTLRKCWDDLLGFFVVFSILFITYVQFFYLLLNDDMEEYSNFISALETCFTAMLAKFDFEDMQRTSTMAAVVIFFFTLTTTYFMISILLIIIINSFEKVKRDISSHPNEYEIISFMTERFKRFLGLKRRNATVHPAGNGECVAKTLENDEQISQLPNKVDAFLEHVNNIYFDGMLDLNGKEALKHMYREKHHRPIFSAGDGGNSSVAQRPLRHRQSASTFIQRGSTPFPHSNSTQ